MIFVVLGTQKFQCNRLLRQIDELMEEGKITETVFAQRGHSDYEPVHFPYADFLPKEEFEKKIAACDILITHSGVGTILAGVNRHKPVIVFPRLKKYKEHVDNHQLDIARAFQKKKLVLMCDEYDKLDELISKSRDYEFSTYQSQRERMIELIETYLREEITHV